MVFAVHDDHPLARWVALFVPGGTYVMIGGGTRQIFAALLLGPLYGAYRGKRVEALTMDVARVPNELEEIRALVACGALRPVVDRVLSLADAAGAIRVLEGGHVRGKIVLDARALAGG